MNWVDFGRDACVKVVVDGDGDVFWCRLGHVLRDVFFDVLLGRSSTLLWRRMMRHMRMVLWIRLMTQNFTLDW